MKITGSKKEFLLFGAVLVSGLALLCAVRFFYRQFEDYLIGTETRGVLEKASFVEPEVMREGQGYIENKRLLNILVMGTDQDAQKAENGSLFRHGGQADFLMVISIDEDSEKVASLVIDRDTMAEINVLGLMGNETGTRCEQICLSYGFGDGREKSCELCAEAVENLLLSIHIDYYIALNMDGISPLNDAIGGVTVEIKDDFTALDPEMCEGKVIKLNGEQAKYFVRERLSIKDSTNKARMVRQKEYLKNACELMAEQIEKDPNAAGRIYDLLKNYLITNMNSARIIEEINKAAGYENEKTLYLEGSHVIGDDGFVEFHADKDLLQDMVLDVFFCKTPDLGN